MTPAGLGRRLSVGGTERVDIGNAPELQLQDFTITTWVKRDNGRRVADNNNAPPSSLPVTAAVTDSS